MKGHARDLMGGPCEAIEHRETVASALARIAPHSPGGFPVLRDGDVVGFLSETDLMGALLRRLPLNTPVSELMTAPARVIDEFATTDDVVRTLREERIHHLPVVRGTRLVGIISPNDVLRFFAKTSPMDESA